MLVDVVAIGLVLGGAAALVRALWLNRRLITTLREGHVRRRWQILMGFEVVFAAGYLGYLFVPISTEISLVEIGVPVVFFLGGIFVWMTAGLALETAKDLMRIGRLRRQAETDPLTRVYNRRYLDRRLNEEIGRAQRYGNPLSVLVIDLDHFKDVNDRYGHQIGDVVLARVGAALADQIRHTDFVARFGGEEFVVVAPETDIDGATDLGERLRLAVEDLRIARPSLDDHLGVTVSVGVARLDPDRPTPKALLSSADQCLYRAKRLGRNRVASPLSREKHAESEKVTRVTSAA